MSGGDSQPAKDKKSRFERVAWPVIALVVPIAITTITTLSMDSRNKREVNARLYTELLSKREDAESALRKDMLTASVERFFKKSSLIHGDSTSVDDTDAMVLYLELITYNFHESLHLSPLFLEVNRRVIGLEPSLKKFELETRLRKLAHKAVFKQVETLTRRGVVYEHTFCISDLISALILQQTREMLGMGNGDTGEDSPPAGEVLEAEDLKAIVLKRGAWSPTGLRIDSTLCYMNRYLQFPGSIVKDTTRVIGQWDVFDQTVLVGDTALLEDVSLDTALVESMPFLEPLIWKPDSETIPGKDEFKSEVELLVLEVDCFNRELGVRLRTRMVDTGARKSAKLDPQKPVKFSVGVFDFPLIDNTRLLEDYRISVFIKKWDEEEDEVKLGIAIFPGYVSGMREKSYLKDVIEEIGKKPSR